jgi:hypothetical protein
LSATVGQPVVLPKAADRAAKMTRRRACHKPTWSLVTRRLARIVRPHRPPSRKCWSDLGD